MGQTLREKWRLDALIGVGGMATVYAATHRNGSRAAVKILHAAMSIHPVTRSRFLREGYAANAVAHSGAVRVIDDDMAEDGSLYLVTELLEGETLSQRAFRRGGRLPENEVLAIADQVLAVLAAAHARGIIHRDIKPDNLFLTSSGELKVLDFGIARLRNSPVGSHVTMTGALIGTPGFMPPEQGRGLQGELDARTDLWAVGATMFQLLSGRPVHAGDSRRAQLLSACTMAAPPFMSVLPGSRASVASVIDRALQFDKARRWPDATRMQQAVRAAYHGRPGARAGGGPGGPAQAGERSGVAALRRVSVRYFWIAALSVALLLSAFSAGLTLRRARMLRAPRRDVGVAPAAVAGQSPSPSPSPALASSPTAGTPVAPASLVGEPSDLPEGQPLAARRPAPGVRSRPHTERPARSSDAQVRAPCLRLDDLGLVPGALPQYACLGGFAQTARSRLAVTGGDDRTKGRVDASPRVDAPQ